MIHIFAANIPQMLRIQKSKIFLRKLDHKEAALGISYIQKHHNSRFTGFKLNDLVISIIRC